MRFVPSFLWAPKHPLREVLATSDAECPAEIKMWDANLPEARRAQRLRDIEQDLLSSVDQMSDNFELLLNRGESIDRVVEESEALVLTSRALFQKALPWYKRKGCWFCCCQACWRACVRLLGRCRAGAQDCVYLEEKRG